MSLFLGKRCEVGIEEEEQPVKEHKPQVMVEVPSKKATGPPVTGTTQGHGPGQTRTVMVGRCFHAVPLTLEDHQFASP